MRPRRHIRKGGDIPKMRGRGRRPRRPVLFAPSGANSTFFIIYYFLFFICKTAGRLFCCLPANIQIPFQIGKEGVAVFLLRLLVLHDVGADLASKIVTMRSAHSARSGS